MLTVKNVTLSILCCFVAIAKIVECESSQFSSSHWRLDSEGKIVTRENYEKRTKRVSREDVNKDDEGNVDTADYVLDILNSAITYNDYWVVEKMMPSTRISSSQSNYMSENDESNSKFTANNLKYKNEPLTCGKNANFTIYDHLEGISKRSEHPNVLEPVYAYISHYKKYKASENSLKYLEMRLKRAREEEPNSASIFNQIGNFWRLKGETLKAIECFRKALAISSDSSEVLINLAQVLHGLNYVDDAIFLAEQSLNIRTHDEGTAWFHHFILAELLKNKGDYEKSKLHFQEAFNLNPDCKIALENIKHFAKLNNSRIPLYTSIVFLIVCISSLMLCGSCMEALDGSRTTILPPHPRTRHRHRNAVGSSLYWSSANGLKFHSYNSRRNRT